MTAAISASLGPQRDRGRGEGAGRMEARSAASRPGSRSKTFPAPLPLLALVALLLLLTLQATTVAAGWIDPDTPTQHHATRSLADGRPLHLVFSDEFDTADRDFLDGHDPRWTAIHKNDYTNYALHYYSDRLVRTTTDGKLNISTIIQEITFDVPDDEMLLKAHKVVTKKMTKNYQSGMVQGWNKFCFTGGVVEISAKLPGQHDIGGLWPAMWLLGNLARATYVSSSNNVWPWSYDTCDYDLQQQQTFSACNRVNHFDLHARQGRGAPEIDIFEVMPGKENMINTPIHKPYMSTSLQISPAIRDYRPNTCEAPDYTQWYHHGLEYGENSSLNIFFYGMHLDGRYPDLSYLADAISSNTNLSASHFEEFHTYRLEWVTGAEGYIKWFIDDVFLFSIAANALNITGAILPEEPMYLILNTAISSTWGFPTPCPVNCPCDCFDCREDRCLCSLPSRMIENFPASFLIDYVRVYQDDTQSVGCSPKSHPTKHYIEAHPEIFMEVPKAAADGSSNPSSSTSSPLASKLSPLKPIQKGGAHCHSNDECGRGRCSFKRCVCEGSFTGPNCRAPEGFDDSSEWSDDSQLFSSFSFPKVPKILLFFSVALLVGLAWGLRSMIQDNRRADRPLVRPSDGVEMAALDAMEVHTVQSHGQTMAGSRSGYQPIQ